MVQHNLILDAMNHYISTFEMYAGDVGNDYIETYTDKNIVFTSGK